MPSKTEIYAAIRDGATTNAEIAQSDHVASSDRKRVANDTKKLAEDGDLIRQRDGRSFVYSIPKNAETEPATAVGETATPTSPATGPDPTGEARMSVIRNYDWTEWIDGEDDVGEYVPTGHEWAKINGLVDRRHNPRGKTHFRLGGPTGAAKTLFARRFAAEREWPCFIVQCQPGMRPSDIFGSTTINADDSALWVDGTPVKALLASRDRPVVLVLDEVNRAPTQVHNTMMELLDDRATLRLDGPRGGEVIAGNPNNLIVFSTMNEGREYTTEHLDPAFKRRLGPKFEVDHLGRARPDAEAQLLVDLTGIDRRLADMLVDCANRTRDQADDDQSILKKGIPTANLIDWAATARDFNDMDMGSDDEDALPWDGDIIEAARDAVVNAFWDPKEQRDRDAVMNIVTGAFDNVTLEDFEDEDKKRLVCQESDCDYGAWEEDVPEDALGWFECPDCGGPIDYANE